jgi:quercetin dioxygenase-like cupin family protein
MAESVKLIQVRSASIATRQTFDWGELIWFASGQQKNCDAMTIGQCVLKPGAANPRHLHPNCTEVLVVQQGRVLHTGPDETQVELREGDTVTIPAGQWHQVVNIGDGPAVLFIAFSSADRQTIGE